MLSFYDFQLICREGLKGEGKRFADIPLLHHYLLQVGKTVEMSQTQIITGAWELYKSIWESRVMFTFNVTFNDSENSNDMGFKKKLYLYCRKYIENNNGTDHQYFKDYKGGLVSIICNETGENVFEVEVK